MAAFAPGAAKRIGDDDGDVQVEQFGQARFEQQRRIVGRNGQQRHPVLAADIRTIYTSVCANESVFGFSDHDVTVHAHNVGGFVQDDFEQARIAPLLGGDFLGELRCFDRFQIDQSAFGFRDDFLRDHHDIATF